MKQAALQLDFPAPSAEGRARALGPSPQEVERATKELAARSLHALSPRRGGPFAAPVEHLIASIADRDRPLPPLKEARDAFERLYLVEILKRCGGRVSTAARLANRNRSDFYDLLRRHGLSPTKSRP